MHITISGKLGSGKSTICKLLHAEHGCEVYSTGAIQREVALQKNVSTLELNRMSASDLSLDTMIDEAVARISAQRTDEVMIFDSRMAWKFAQNSFKVFFVVDPVVAANRVMNAPRGNEERYADAEEARAQLVARAKLENERFKQIYGVDNFDYANYDLVLDTSRAAPEALARTVYEQFRAFSQAAGGEPCVLLSPTSLFPLRELQGFDFVGMPDELERRRYLAQPITVAVHDGYHYIVEGHRLALAAIRNREAFVRVRLADIDHLPERIAAAGLPSLRTFEAAGLFAYDSCPPFYLSPSL